MEHEHCGKCKHEPKQSEQLEPIVYRIQIEPFEYDGPLQETQTEVPESSSDRADRDAYFLCVAEAQFGDDDRELLTTDIRICAGMKQAVVSEKMRAACQADLDAAAKRGWKRS